LYDLLDYKNADQYARTTKEIADHVGINGADTWESILNMAETGDTCGGYMK